MPQYNGIEMQEKEVIDYIEYLKELKERKFIKDFSNVRYNQEMRCVEYEVLFFPVKEFTITSNLFPESIEE